MTKRDFHFKSEYLKASVLLICFFVSFAIGKIDTDVPMGWAAVPTGTIEKGLSGANVISTIGGGDGKLVTATSSDELKSYAGSSEPLVIIANGSFSGGITFANNKTLIGGGSGATLKGGFTLNKVSNIIVRNFEVTGGTDAFGISGGHHIWIDHCNLYSCGDGLIDITNGADQVTVSWTKFSKHHKTMLINNGKKKPEDKGRLNVTLHHLFFNGTKSRHPRVGFGRVQILNNYYLNIGNYAIHTHWDCRVVVERCFFKGVKDPVSEHGPAGGPSGNAVLIDNVYQGGSPKKKSTTDESKIFKVTDYYLYNWVVDEVDEVPGIVENGAGTGAAYGSIGAIPTPGQGAATVSTSPLLKWTKVGSEPSSKLYFGKTNPPPELTTVDGYSHQMNGLDAGTIYYWKVGDGDVWVFRTSGSYDPNKKVAVNPAKRAPYNAMKIQKKVHNGSKVLIGVQKQAGEKDLYDLNGRNHINLKDQSGKAKK